MDFWKTDKKLETLKKKISWLTSKCYNSAILPPREVHDHSKFSSGHWLLGKIVSNPYFDIFGADEAYCLRVTPKCKISRKFNFGANFLKILLNNIDFWGSPLLHQSKLLLLAFYRPQKGWKVRILEQKYQIWPNFWKFPKKS